MSALKAVILKPIYIINNGEVEFAERHQNNNICETERIYR